MAIYIDIVLFLYYVHSLLFVVICQARDMGDTQLFNRQELTIIINTLCKQ